jgi:hypothetical protein
MQVLQLLEGKCGAVLRRQADTSMETVESIKGKDITRADWLKCKEIALKNHELSLNGRLYKRLKDQSKHAITLPKRLFRALRTSPDGPRRDFDAISLPLLRHLLGALQADPDSSNGYALAKAVLARHFELIRLLLEHGASPSIKENLPVMLAIGRNDIEIVRMLVEQDYRPSEGDEPVSADTSAGQQESSKKGRKRLSSQTSSPTGRNGSSPGKRRRLEDRIKVTSGMLEQAVKQEYVPLIDYFMGKGAVPNMRTLAMLSR